jgi:hypothetical protein
VDKLWITTAIGWGIDYARFAVVNEAGLEYVMREAPYLDVSARNYHGGLFVDLTGDMLGIVRLFDSVYDVLERLARLFRCTRLDIYVDLEGDWLAHVEKRGTEIHNCGTLETVYSHNLGSRGNVPVFARAYDAMAAGHYAEPVTRFEVELKRQKAAQQLGVDGFVTDPVQLALCHIARLFGLDITIDGLAGTENGGEVKRPEHDRERFYRHYGRAILADMQEMGVQGLQMFIKMCLDQKESEKCHQ